MPILSEAVAKRQKSDRSREDVQLPSGRVLDRVSTQAFAQSAGQASLPAASVHSVPGGFCRLLAELFAGGKFCCLFDRHSLHQDFAQKNIRFTVFLRRLALSNRLIVFFVHIFYFWYVACLYRRYAYRKQNSRIHLNPGSDAFLFRMTGALLSPKC